MLISDNTMDLTNQSSAIFNEIQQFEPQGNLVNSVTQYLDLWATHEAIQYARVPNNTKPRMFLETFISDPLMHTMIEKTTVNDNQQTIFHSLKNGTIITDYNHVIKRFKQAAHLADQQ